GGGRWGGGWIRPAACSEPLVSDHDPSRALRAEPGLHPRDLVALDDEAVPVDVRAAPERAAQGLGDPLEIRSGQAESRHDGRGLAAVPLTLARPRDLP